MKPPLASLCTLWTRHETPAGGRTFGSPKLYVPLSVTGWEPFKAK